MFIFYLIKSNKFVPFIGPLKMYFPAIKNKSILIQKMKCPAKSIDPSLIPLPRFYLIIKSKYRKIRF